MKWMRLMSRFRVSAGVLTVVLGMSSALRAETSGTAAYTFLNIPVGARATGMGEAFTSVPNDIQSLAYNPASLATLVASQLSFQHLSYVEDTTQEAFAFGHAGRQQSMSWGFSTNYLRVGSIPRTIANPNDNGTDDGFTQTGNFSTYDLAVGGSVAGTLMDGLFVGSTVKLVRESLADASASAGAVDLGVIYTLMEQRSCNIGVSVQNAGFSSKFADASVKLPLTMRVGISGQPFAQWLLTTDFIKQIDTQGQFNVGAEVTPQKMLSFRVGYQYALQRPDLGGFSNFSLGAGLRFPRWSVDYAFLPLGDLGTSHRISINFRFAPKLDHSNESRPVLAPVPTPAASEPPPPPLIDMVTPPAAVLAPAVVPSSVTPSVPNVVAPSTTPAAPKPLQE